jgi:hypothetical protein
MRDADVCYTSAVDLSLTGHAGELGLLKTFIEGDPAVLLIPEFRSEALRAITGGDVRGSGRAHR